MAQATRTRETRLERLQRLYDKACREELDIIGSKTEAGIYVVTSSRDRRVGYFVYVVADGRGNCECEGYQKYQACKHYALALAVSGIMQVPDTL